MARRLALRAFTLLLSAQAVWLAPDDARAQWREALPGHAPAVMAFSLALAAPGGRAASGPGASLRMLAGSDQSCGPPGRRDLPDPRDPCAGFGSGIFVTVGGEILTSGHVVDGCTRIAV